MPNDHDPREQSRTRALLRSRAMLLLCAAVLVVAVPVNHVAKNAAAIALALLAMMVAYGSRPR